MQCIIEADTRQFVELAPIEKDSYSKNSYIHKYDNTNICTKIDALNSVGTANTRQMSEKVNTKIQNTFRYIISKVAMKTNDLSLTKAD